MCPGPPVLQHVDTRYSRVCPRETQATSEGYYTSSNAKGCYTCATREADRVSRTRVNPNSFEHRADGKFHSRSNIIPSSILNRGPSHEPLVAHESSSAIPGTVYTGGPTGRSAPSTLMGTRTSNTPSTITGSVTPTSGK
jgi:hypothetical protein